MSDTLFRQATKADIDALVAIENRCFTEDRLTQRNFQWMLEKAHADIIVAEMAEDIIGYGLLLYRRGTSLARLYSLAILPEHRGGGLASSLLSELEQCARLHDCVYLRLEVRPDNERAIALYRRLGYRQFSRKLDYYEDHSEALCFEKRVIYPQPVTRVAVPYYRQTTEFTCGPASLLMAMAALKEDQEQSQAQELQLWRESTTIFMTSGHGGCGPHGLALAAYRRGFDVEMYLSDQQVLFIDSVRNAEKRQVITLVQQDFMRQLQDTTVKIHYQKLMLDELTGRLDEGRIPLVLISTYRINRNKAPHWVVITAHDSHFVYIHDPDMEEGEHASMTDNIYVPVPKNDFPSMARFGRRHLQTALVLSRN
ncbi:GNAT family N-acetyltransferase/peptidase C39 family protein [Methylomarinum sp. Ch1-1]|uniref:GNAT family N-acetyltransferase/peptidase C39 family protein n=1 Tax=Methylomarinum roseum TaxID=3067653 RepID=A0AAU7NUW3_9GAMM|nr:GNAT family N-acetyltransferase/peptidase C39 family protein [Methylomarinum sp. Ch1-1]MDP4519175.1 GNAT family N-acetyltransferase/peptidase C39 family protein [Methylomarinum sp. Ch1-1]